MKLGLFMMPLHPPEKDRTECFEEDIELVVLADQLGVQRGLGRAAQYAGLGADPLK